MHESARPHRRSYFAVQERIRSRVDEERDALPVRSSAERRDPASLSIDLGEGVSSDFAVLEVDADDAEVEKAVDVVESRATRRSLAAPSLHAA